MTIEKAVSQIGYKFKNCFFDRHGNKRDKNYPFVPSQEDFEAYNFIVEFVEKKQGDQLMNDLLFAKLYIYLLDKFCDYYKADISDIIPQKELNRIVDMDLRQLVGDLTDKLNLHRTEYHIKQNNSLEGLELIAYDEVADNLKIMINGALNTYNN